MLRERRAHRSGARVREPIWTEALGVGSRWFVDLMEAKRKNRRRVERREADKERGQWILSEEAEGYG
jgi:hypothetical protein